MKTHLLALAVAGTALAGTAAAAPFAPFDVRAAGMGGTGVASAKSASAALFNPAMLSSQVKGDKFQILLGLGAQITDRGEFVDDVDDLQTTLDELDQLTQLIENETITPGVYSDSLLSAGNLTNRLSGEFTAISGDSVSVLPGGALGVGVPGQKLGIGLFIAANGLASASPTVSPADTAIMDQYADIMSDGVVSTAELQENNALFEDPATNGNRVVIKEFDSQSTVTGVGILIGEVGVALSRQMALENGGLLNVGVTPKLLDVTTYHYKASTEDQDDIEIEDYESTDSGFDIDVGVMFKASQDSAWQYGVVVKNLIGNDFQTNPGITDTPIKIDLDPQLRAGVARTTNRTTLAVDLDITKNSGTTGNDSTQFLALGAELDIKLLQLRAGYRTNLANSDVGDVVTAGIGLGPVDLTAMIGDDTVGAFLQFGFGW